MASTIFFIVPEALLIGFADSPATSKPRRFEDIPESMFDECAGTLTNDHEGL